MKKIGGLPQDTVNKINQIFSQFNDILIVTLYGSRAKGNFRPGSDIDLSIKLKPNAHESLDLINQISSQLDDLNIIYQVDVSLFSHIENPSLIEHINRVGLVFYPA